MYIRLISVQQFFLHIKGTKLRNNLKAKTVYIIHSICLVPHTKRSMLLLEKQRC